MNRKIIFAAAGAALLLAVAAPLSASAHVTVAPDSAPAGSWVLIDIKVPNESATAGTNKVELHLPTDTPVTNVSYVPVAGWTTELVRETLPAPVEVGGNTITEAVTSVIWTADPGHEIIAGQLQVFPLSMGPIPDTGKLVMIADQTYTDGTIVSWSETTEGASHPAPTLYVNDVPVSDHHSGDHSSDDHSDDHSGEDHNSDDHSDGATNGGPATSSDTVARGLAIGGLAVGAIGVAVAISALRRKSV